MQSKGFIKLIAALLALACVFQLSFTFKTRNVEKHAAAYAAQFPLEQQAEAEQHYLDSVQNLPVYNLGFISYTYKDCKEKELNLGLDLKGGMNVMLEVQVEDLVKALAGQSQNDPAFIAAMAEANEAMKEGTSKDYIGEFVKAYERQTNGGSLATVFVSPDRKDLPGPAPTPRSKRSSSVRPRPPSRLPTTCSAAVSTTSASRSPTSSACPIRTASWSSCRASRSRSVSATSCRVPLRSSSGPPTTPTRSSLR